MLCNNCVGESCGTDDFCSDFHDWLDEKWEKVCVMKKLAIQWKKEKKTFFLFFFFRFLFSQC